MFIYSWCLQLAIIKVKYCTILDINHTNPKWFKFVDGNSWHKPPMYFMWAVWAHLRLTSKGQLHFQLSYMQPTWLSTGLCDFNRPTGTWIFQPEYLREKGILFYSNVLCVVVLLVASTILLQHIFCSKRWTIKIHVTRGLVLIDWVRKWVKISIPAREILLVGKYFGHSVKLLCVSFNRYR